VFLASRKLGTSLFLNS